MDELIDGRWYGVTTGNGIWFPALRDDSYGNTKWHNGDTWFDDPEPSSKIVDWKLIPLPHELE